MYILEILKKTESQLSKVLIDELNNALQKRIEEDI